MSERAERLITSAVEAKGLARGTLEAVRALERREARVVFIASDADRPELLAPVRELARSGGVPVIERHDRATLGRWARIERPAAVLAVTEIHEREVFLAEILADASGVASTLSGLQALARAAGGADALESARTSLAALAAPDPDRERALATLFVATLRLAADAGVDLGRVADRLTLADWLSHRS